ncbi:MAG: membrane protein insertase YidC [Nitrospirota bacterium]
MEKRALIAVAISFTILLVYQFFFAPKEQQPVVQPPATVQEQEKPAPSEPVQPALPMPKPAEALAETREIKVDTELYSAVFSSLGATIKHYELKNYKDKDGKNVVLLKERGAVPPLGMGSKDDFDFANVNFSVTGRDLVLNKDAPSGSLTFEYSEQGISVRRTYTFGNDNYRIDIKDEVSGLSEYWMALGSDFGIHDKTDTSVHVGPVVLQGTDRKEFDNKKLGEPARLTKDLRWIAQEDKYFFASLVPLSPMEEAKIWQYKDSPVSAFKGNVGTNSFILYAGPKEYDRLKNLKVGLEHIVDFGFFSILAVPLFWVLKFFYQLIGNYGWAIILLTLVTRIPFIPLINKSQKSMRKLQELQPKMAELREKFKKDPQKQQQEMMGLYKKHKVNPVGGCLPILLQIPVFFALYKILLIAVELRGAPFMLWIQDLSAPDTLFGHIPAWLPLIGGFAVGPLPIVMGATMVIQQKMTPTSLDPTQNKLMMLMPIVFTFLFLNFASGLVVYWLMNNIFSIIQQFYANRKIAKEAAQ